LDARFYFYFPDERAARAAKPRLETQGVSVQIKPGADNASWLALGSASLAGEEQLDEYEERFHELAEDLGADYDGYDRG
jgi:hypothetical protein